MARSWASISAQPVMASKINGARNLARTMGIPPSRSGLVLERHCNLTLDPLRGGAIAEVSNTDSHRGAVLCDRQDADHDGSPIRPGSDRLRADLVFLRVRNGDIEGPQGAQRCVPHPVIRGGVHLFQLALGLGNPRPSARGSA